MNQGHLGPVRFITSVEVPKNQHVSSNSENNKEANSLMFKTIAVSGGEGYEEYKALINTGNTTGNGLISNEIATINSAGSGQNINVNSTCQSLSSNTPAAFQLQSQSSFPASNSASGGYSDGENSLGKDDLVNYVLAWEV